MKFSLKSKTFTELEIEPQKPAIIGKNYTLTWQQLKDSAFELQRILQSRAIPKSHPVIILGDDEPRQIAAMLACMMCELPYAQVESSVPAGRFATMKAILKSEVLIRCNLPDWRVESSLAINSCLEPKDVVYVTFTSGSTGPPKAVLCTWNNIYNFTKWYNSTGMKLQDKDAGINHFVFSFDGSCLLTINFLEAGATLIHLRSCDNADFAYSHSPSVWASTPSALSKSLMAAGFESSHLPNLRRFIVGGEVVPRDLVARVWKKFPDAEVWSVYGTTETTVTVSAVKITPEIFNLFASLPIAEIKNCEALRLVNSTDSLGIVSGEIEIFGESVGPGYLRNAELTQSKFLISETSELCYRTGDFGYVEHGYLFFQGRMDFQVKLHGYRIDLGEIETQVFNSGLVKDCACIGLKRDGLVKKIVCFLTSDNSDPIAGLKKYLEENLPVYMIPGGFCVLPEMPLNKNLKTDRNELVQLYLKSQNSES